MMLAGNPLCWPKSPEASRARPAAVSASWLRWAVLRVSPVDGFRGRGAVEAGGGLVGVAHARGGQLGEHGVDGGAGLRGQIPADRAHAVAALLADGDTAAAGSILVAEIAVGVKAIGELVGQLGQLVGAILAAQLRQLGLGLHPGLDIDEVRQPVHKPADHRHMGGAEVPGALGGGGGLQPRRQRLTGDRPTLAQILGLADAPTGFGAADPQPIGQHRRQPAPQLALTGLLADLIDQRMLHRGQLAAKPLAALQDPQPLRGGQHIKGQLQRALHASLQRIEDLHDLLTTTR